MPEFKEAVIVSACRTAIGEFLGSLKNLTGAEMGAIVLKECVDRAGIDPDLIDDVIMGQTCADTREVNVARVAALKAGFSYKVPGMTVNRVCPSSLEALDIAAARIQLGQYDVVLAGGTDSMSQVPHILRTHRLGTKLRDDRLIDSLWEGMKGRRIVDNGADR